MLATTRKRPLKKISEITFDLEIINPIESKNLFGGCDYKWDCGCNDNLWWHNPNPSGNFDGPGGFIGFSSSGNSGGDNGGGGSYGGYYDSYNDIKNDTNYDSNYDGIADADDLDNNGIKDECTLSNLPLKVEQQIGNLCVFNTFTFAANLMGSNITFGQMMQNMAAAVVSNPNNSGTSDPTMLMASGLTIQQTYIALNQVFFATNATNTNQIEAALCLNQPVLAQFQNHQVVIVGYNSNNQAFTIADSQWGSNNGYRTINYYSISEVFILTGIRQ